jgi:MFS family permease
VLTTTPIDAHLPLVIALVLACAWAARGIGFSGSIQCAVPLLIAAMMMIADERTRLMAYGIIVASAFGVAAIATARESERWRLAGWPGGVSPPTVVLAVVGVILLRWIPLRDVHVVKELVLLTGSIALLFAVRRRDADEPAGATPALISVLFLAVVTPIPPGKMALLPLTVAVLVLITRRVPQVVIGAAFLVAAFFARYSLATIYIAVAIVFLMPLLDRVKPLTYATAIAIFALWPWSGIIARALPVVRNYEPATGSGRAVSSGLAASEAIEIGVPPHVRHVVVTTSGGQMARLKPGRVVGTLEARDSRGHTTTRPITIGDIADFGFTRRDQFFASRNPLPHFSSAEIRDYGANAWVWGGGRTAIAAPADIASLRVVAAPNLPQHAHLQIDSVEFPAR